MHCSTKKKRISAWSSCLWPPGFPPFFATTIAIKNNFETPKLSRQMLSFVAVILAVGIVFGSVRDSHGCASAVPVNPDGNLR